jgi:hypothetical protein
MSAQPNPLNAAPDWVTAHTDVFLEDEFSGRTMLRACKRCRTYFSSCHCGGPVQVNMVLADEDEKFYNQQLIDECERNKNGIPVESVSQAPTFFESIALPLIDRGWKVAPCYPRKKMVHTRLVPKPLDMISSDAAKIHEWGLAEPDANVCVYAQQIEGGLLFLDKDGAVSLREKYEHETGKMFPKTLLVCSSVISDGNGGTITKGHWYFRQTPRTLALKNISEDSTGGLFSLRVDNEYVTSIGSIHPNTGLPYEVAEAYPIEPMPDDFLDWLQAQVVKKPQTREEIVERGKFGKGSRYPALISETGRLWQRGYSAEDTVDTAIKWARENFDIPEGAFDESLVRSEAQRIVDTYRQGDPTSGLLALTQQRTSAQNSGQMVVVAQTIPISAATVPVQVAQDADIIPAFDSSVITGIYKKIVDLVCLGTTIPPQFAFLAAKVFIGARMASQSVNGEVGRMKFENLEDNSCYYGAPIAETGTGKGLAWKRMMSVFKINGILNCGVKIINSADSGAGLRDVFFEPPENQPVICYIDEVTSLGHKGGDKKQPEIVDAIIELANSSGISRVKAKQKGQKVNLTTDNAHLALYMCGQNGEVFMSSFAGRTALGLYDRFYPEYSEPVEAGDLPEISQADAALLLDELYKMNFTGRMTMAPETKLRLDEFWKSQSAEVRKKPRLKTYLSLDMYMSAWGRGRMIAELEDLNAAIKIFERQLIIRRIHFTVEVPDKIGLYLGKLKTITEQMRRRLKAGDQIGQVARSLRDLQTETRAYANNELHIFDRAWSSWKGQMAVTKVPAANGHLYDKFIPVPNEDETWAPPPQ